MSTNSANATSVEQHLNEQVANAKTLVQQGEFAQAEQRLSLLLQRADFEDATREARVQVLYAMAVAQRYQEKHTTALETLSRLQALAPQYSRGYQEQGHVHFTVDAYPEATEAYEHAVRLNASLLASWKALSNLYQIGGREADANRALQQVQVLSALPPALLSVTSLLHDNDLEKAEQLCRHYLREHRHDVEGMRLLAEIAVRLEVLDDAEFLLESALEFAPDNERVRFDYANVLLRRQKFAKAHEQADELAQGDPDNLAVQSLLGSACAGIGDNTRAIALYNDVLEESPSQHRVLVLRGHAQKTIGRLEHAIASYQQAYQVNAYYGDAFWSLANTKTYRFSQAELAHMRQYEASPHISTEDRVHMCFALGKAFEDAREYEQAFAHYALGNALKKTDLRFRVERMQARADAQIRICNDQLFAANAGLGDPSPDPIFIVGLPRAGSTLLEQILASHSMVDGTLELPNVLSLVNRLTGDRTAAVDDSVKYPRILTGIDPTYWARFGKQYLDDTRVFRAGAPYFIDKMPNNFFHLGLIKLILPNAKIIDARRHPMACCFSGFKQLFGQGQEFSYGLQDIGAYYRKYVELMDHWEAVLPGFVLRVQHEDVVDDLESQVRRMLDFCGLPFEPQCLDFHRTERSVRTPSSEQVRQPIYRTGLAQWKHFEPWLGPLAEALGPQLYPPQE